MAKYNIPLYGANKDGGDIGDFNDFLMNVIVLADTSFRLEGNTADQTIYTAGAQECLVLGGFVDVKDCKIDATGVAGGDYQANGKVIAVSASGAAGITAAGVDGRVYFGGGQLANAETVLLESTGSAGNSADVRIVVYGIAYLDLT